MNEREKAISEIIKKLIDGERKLDSIKKEAAKKYKLASMIKNSEILTALKTLDTKLGTEHWKRFIGQLQKRPMRTLSGVTPIALMVKPDGSCPYNCIYCPSGIAAKSYTGYEPAAMRARQENFDPYKQVVNRLTHYTECGHTTDKCEIIVMGGTFLQMPIDYQQSFIKGVYDGLNNKESKSLEQAKKSNERAVHRCIGLTIETRPDVCGEEEIKRMLDYGATRVELGVQHPDDKIYKKIKRGHTVEDVMRATAQLKDSAFKVCYHLMPGLPGSNPNKDVEMVRQIFSNPNFRPDMLKIYPTLVMPETELENLMKKGEYAPYSSEQAADVISELYRYIPNYVRVMRIMRDIPANLIGCGTTKSNLREIVEKKLKEKNIQSKEIRSREVGLLGEEYKQDEFRIQRTDYDASEGREIFLSCVNDSDFLAGFIRLRNPNSSHRKEIDKNCALIRELHVYGSEIKIGHQGSTQHKGIGAKLLSEAEKIAKDEFDKKKMIIISGVGAKEYYRKLNYSDEGPYVSKNI
jgi:elongator complex protein 3